MFILFLSFHSLIFVCLLLFLLPFEVLIFPFLKAKCHKIRLAKTGSIPIQPGDCSHIIFSVWMGYRPPFLKENSR
jgi:hypothetical protein